MGKAEPDAMNIKEQSESTDSHEAPSQMGNIFTSSTAILPDPAADDHQSGKNVPRWLRPFLSLRVQLMFVYSIILLLAVTLTCFLIYRHTSPVYIASIALGTFLAGLILTYICISLLMRPLSRVIDAAQAIALGDLKQRKRLPLRLPPQDDIDRLSGSIGKMVTQLEKAEEMQHSSEQRFKRFFSDASHQLRTPLTSIRGFTEILMRGATEDPETARRVLTRMKSETERMTILINNILTLARLDDNRSLKTQYIDVIELATESIKQARTRAEEGCKISLVLATHERLGIQADRERIQQLLFILLDNAIKHGHRSPDGMITLYLDKQHKRVIIRVVDNGAGISREDLSHIFEEFYRGHNQHRPPGTSAVGAGLGLTIAHAIVRVHQGTITAYSDPGQTTEFKVILPAAD